VLRLAEWGRLDLGEHAPEAPAAPAPGGLTTRELQVLRLLAEGLTDREIAERLVISVKTASHHVSHILGKLNARGRVEAASKAQQLGLLDA
jgi:DNA-binding NarL/FixJ family response regulator